MEDFGQIFRVYPKDKYKKANYEMIGEVVWREVGEEGFADYVRRLVVNAAIGNGDMHLKNWSLFYPDGRKPQLAPIYDYVSTLTYVQSEGMGLNLADSKRFEDVRMESFIALADRVKAPTRPVVKVVKDTVEQIHAVWKEVAKEAELPKVITQAITDHLGRLPLLRQ
jgi:serine/threonine-protein kinase HipA